jgi:hemerythrin-like domain-containing protein
MINNKPKGEAFWGGVLILTVVLGVIALIALSLSSCKKKDTTASQGAVVVANKAYIESLKRHIAISDSIIALYELKDSLSQSKQSEIVTKFKPVYEKINTDTGIVNQWNYLHVLLAETKRTAIKRD